MNDKIKTSAEAEEAAALPRRYEVIAKEGVQHEDLPAAVAAKPVQQ